MRRPRRLLADTRGATIIEFAIVMPVMMLLIMGMSELAYQAYIQATLVGAVQKAGRDSALQYADTAAIDQQVMAQVWRVAKNATWKSKRLNYSQFGSISAEYYYDTNGNNKYDAATECFIDVNGNKTWDADPGIVGQGGANDVTMYTMTVTYTRLFPVAALLNWPSTKDLVATTILKNQPYNSQTAYSPTKVCPS